ncbi:Nucleoside triphosphate pyrophosphohydrolase [bioreactor metagenome]|uniref:Nucleoside triphosphate pyrophosphohydrolase n=1 Tax=bioreactor metagenome TaxID=1076179 RepID=A0A645FR18_9ZZZZ
MESLRPLTIEETYELSEAILMNDNKNISKELGDILLHIVFYAKIGKEQKNFDISDVMNLLCDKLIYRHPHVFGEKEVSGSQEVISNWENLKTKEKDGNKTILSGVPESLPSVVKAYRMQDKARAVGFDWDVKEDVWNKVKEELTEFESELRSTSDNNLERAEKEFGDLMFSLINAARLYKINPDSALEMTNMKFRKRFDFLEQRVKSQGRSLKEMTLAEMDVIWEEAKKVVG